MCMYMTEKTSDLFTSEREPTAWFYIMSSWLLNMLSCPFSRVMELFFLYLFIDTYFKEEIVYNIVTSDLQHNRVRGSVGDICNCFASRIRTLLLEWRVNGAYSYVHILTKSQCPLKHLNKKSLLKKRGIQHFSAFYL